MPASFSDQLVIVEELLREVRRMESGERRFAQASAPDDYERELRLAGLAQRIAQAYTMMEGVLAFVARRIDRTPLTGQDWHKRLIARCTQSGPARPAFVSTALAGELLELCEFRHVVRNIYPTHLDARKVRDNLDRLIRAAQSFSAECAAFAVRLAATAKPRRGKQKRAEKIRR